MNLTLSYFIGLSSSRVMSAKQFLRRANDPSGKILLKFLFTLRCQCISFFPLTSRRHTSTQVTTKAAISGGPSRKPTCDSLCETKLSPPDSEPLRSPWQLFVRGAGWLHASESAEWK